jgi:hypothetical protein
MLVIPDTITIIFSVVVLLFVIAIGFFALKE